ncbi:MAG: hypothetical protein ACRD18_14090 [Terriglobia bacterium]
MSRFKVTGLLLACAICFSTCRNGQSGPSGVTLININGESHGRHTN